MKGKQSKQIGGIYNWRELFACVESKKRLERTIHVDSLIRITVGASSNDRGTVVARRSAD